ncbi:type III secretion protein [Arsenophonus nasoniae]|uniref:Type III secretion protein n=1 Tax=Arsenophonus nasoniae TaxID=638 RepID=A0AA95GEY8_9GAMM|nr:type III secretion protein [Arsenophonus nasoniae]WGL95093.1 type III secretion protein [Arsenophonus nasoniae]
MQMDLASLVTDAIKTMGKPDLFPQGHQLNNHSTITLELEELPDIHIAMVNDLPIIWANLGYVEFNVIRQLSEPLLACIISNHLPFFYPGQPSYFLNDENILELRANFSTTALEDPTQFAEAIDNFFQYMLNIPKLLIG